MPNNRVKLIVNPNADLGRARVWCCEFASNHRRVWWSGFGSTRLYPTHAVELAHQAAEEGYELVVAVGGDGTAHEVVNGIMKVPAERRPKLGVVPLGSGNDFSYAIGVNSLPSQALRQVFTGKSMRVDVGRFQDNLGRMEYFINAIGIGFDTVVTIRSRRIKLLRGFLIYLVAVIQTIIFNHDAPRMQVNTD